VTFDGTTDADAWLATVNADIARERYVCPVERKAADEAARQSGPGSNARGLVCAAVR
jgi:hypothetical protein